MRRRTTNRLPHRPRSGVLLAAVPGLAVTLLATGLGCRQGATASVNTPLTPIGPLPGTSPPSGQMAPSTGPSFMSPMMGSTRVPPPSPAGSSAAGGYQSPPGGNQSGVFPAATGGAFAAAPGPASSVFPGSVFPATAPGRTTAGSNNFAGRAGTSSAADSGLRPVAFNTPAAPSQPTGSDLRLAGLPLNDLTQAVSPPGYASGVDPAAPMRAMPPTAYRTPDITPRGSFAGSAAGSTSQFGGIARSLPLADSNAAANSFTVPPGGSGTFDSRTDSGGLTPLTDNPRPLPTMQETNSRPLSADPKFRDATDSVRFRRPSPRF